MSWYRSGTVTAAAGQNVITGTGTLWNNPIFGIASGQMIFVPGAGQVVIYEILAVDSDTKIRTVSNVTSSITNSDYAIVTTVSNSMSDLARRTAVQLALYQKLLEDWQDITTGTGDVTIIAPDGTEVVIPALGEGSLVPIGVPLPYPLATPPAGFIKCNGSSFSTAEYPKLALVYPSGILPDLRGEFIRGWDDVRGVDSGRGLLTVESDQIRSHRHLKLNVDNSGVAYGPGAGNFSGQQTGGFYLNMTIGYDSGTPGIGTGATGGLETRPRNIAFNYIVRAI